MHMLQVILGGTVLLGVFALFGKLWGEDAAGIATAAKAFIPVWIAVALINMWVGVTKAGYTIAQELPILVLVVAIPVAIAALTIWKLARA